MAEHARRGRRGPALGGGTPPRRPSGATQHDTLKARIEIRYAVPTPTVTIECLIEMTGTKRRSEIFSKDVPGQVILRDGEECHSYRRKKLEDVHIYDLQESVSTRADVAFDPRILGLNDLLPANMTVKNCLWPSGVDKLEVAGRESFHGVSVWRVRASRKDEGTTFEYWIEEPSFRVHRFTVKANSTEIDIDSTFDPSDLKSPFPQRVVTRRREKAQNSSFERTYSVKSFEVNPEISPERFTLGSIELPINTMVVDYRIKPITGYWDGEGLSKNPVYQGERLRTVLPALGRIQPIAGDRG